MNIRELFRRTPTSPAHPLACVPSSGSGISALLRVEAPEALEEASNQAQPLWVRNGGGSLPLRLDICTDFGPPDDDKLCNQDAVAFTTVHAPLPGLVVALADGVSNSPYSEFGARLVVQTARTYLPDRLRDCPSGKVPEAAWWQDLFDDLTQRIRGKMFALWCRLQSAPGSFLPVGWHPSIFGNAVQQKNVFLSTMLVAIALRDADDRYWGYFAHVGDGALSFCRDPLGAPQVVDALVCDPQTILDSFLSPEPDRPCFPQCSFAQLGAQFLLCLATDGVARAVPLRQMLTRFQQQQENCSANLAQCLIQELKQQVPDQVADNLSLAFLTRTGPQPRAASASEDLDGGISHGPAHAS